MFRNRLFSSARRPAVLATLGLLSGAFACLPSAHAQASSKSTTSEWLTSSGDQARDGWQQAASKITPANARKLQMLWKTKLTSKTMGMLSFREPLIVTGIKAAGGTHTEAIFAGASNDVHALDADTGKVLWETNLKWASATPQEPGEGRGFICTNALSATPVVSPIDAQVRRLYVLTSDGYLRTIDLSTGEETDPPVQMLSMPYGKPYGLNLVNNVVYTVTGQGCGGVPNALYAYNLTSKKLTVSQPPQAGLWGTAGPSVGADGTIYFESGDGAYDAAAGKLSTSVEAFTFNDDTLKLKDYYSPSNHIWLTRRDLDMNATPAIFPFHGKELLVGSGKEGRFFIMDSKSLGGANHETPLLRTPLFSNKNVNFQTEGTWGSMATWEDKHHTRWILSPTGGELAVPFPVKHGPAPHGGVIAMKLVETAGKVDLKAAWTSEDMLTAEPPVVANGVVYVLAGGEFTGQANDEEGGLFSATERIKRSKPARLYALDALTGKTLYSSGDQVSSFLHQAGLSVADDKVLFGTFDGTVYCFGLK
ncbi:MAG TPA: PQQ-binding-like beta-propeller repeat protein [Acidobacteriaceae bacterium]|nr:PQQ-binding-like beta-propeller repeat protein [Acidobacteriaceae bacterium]